MKKHIFVIASILSFCTFALAAGAVKGIPRFVRQMPDTEVFFKDDNQRYIIPKNDSHNAVLEKVVKAMKAGQSISLQVDPVSRALSEAKVEPKAETKAEPVKDSSDNSR